jgi:gamma-glutamyltranspeptidase/glutathione hydrolase
MLEGASHRIAFALLVGLALFVACTTVKETPELPGAGPVIERFDTDASQSIYGMAATGSVEASRIAVEILESGGNAIDATVAAAFALGVTNPGDCGLGGTTYIVIRFADGGATVVDGSALVPLRFDRNRLEEMQTEGLEYGIGLTAVPASLAALDYATTRYGTLPLADLIEPAVELAFRGYYAMSFQEVSIRSYFDDLLKSDFLRYLILESGETPPTTDTLQCRPILANTLSRIATGGSAEFYRGSIAGEIAADMAERGGFVSRDDLGIIRIREVAPLRGTYRGTEVLTPPHPSMGGAVIEALKILEQFPSEFLGQDTVDRHQVVAEAFHMAIGDHERLLQDRSFAAARSRERLLTKEHAEERAALIEIGRPVVSDEFPSVAELKDDDGNTTQISIVDRWGNAVSLTQSLGRFFGSKTATPALGFPYNSLLEGLGELTARDPIPTYMCPSIVTSGDDVLLVLGSASSNRIPGVVATVISNFVDRRFDLHEAVLAPRVLWNTGEKPGVYVEVFPPITAGQIKVLKRFGYKPIFRAQLPARLSQFAKFGAVNAVHFDRESRVMTGVGDPRRNGTSLGAGF